MKARLLRIAAVSAVTVALLVTCTTPPPPAGLPVAPAMAAPPALPAEPLTAAEAEGLTAEEVTAANLYRRFNRAVVNITAAVARRRLGRIALSYAAGSGSIIDPSGLVLTNRHVVQGATMLMVTLYDGTSFEAQVVGVDPENDLAVIRFQPSGARLETIRTAEPGRLHVGQRVYALGNPFGLERTLTVGIVSATGRVMPTAEGVIMRDLIQTDASINPGNSGGPLLNARGEMIGVNTAIISPVGASVGLGFAVPASIVQRVVPDLITKGHVQRGWIDIAPVPLFPFLVRVGGISVRSGILVSQVASGGKAAEAGLRGGTRGISMGSWGGMTVYLGGDVIVAIDGRPVSSFGEYLNALEGTQPHSTVRLDVVRGRQRLVLNVVLSERPDANRGQ